MPLNSVSIRYAVLLVPEPAFTSRAYRARQIICGQYGSWAAEMLMVHLMLSRFFPCHDDHLPEFTAGLAAIASDSRETAPGFPMSHHGVACLEEAPGDHLPGFHSPGTRPPVVNPSCQGRRPGE